MEYYNWCRACVRACVREDASGNEHRSTADGQHVFSVAFTCRRREIDGNRQVFLEYSDSAPVLHCRCCFVLVARCSLLFL